MWWEAIPSGWCGNGERTVRKLVVKSWYNKVTARCGPESSVRARLTEFGQICQWIWLQQEGKARRWCTTIYDLNEPNVRLIYNATKTSEANNWLEEFLELVTVPHVLTGQFFGTLCVPVVFLDRVVRQMNASAHPATHRLVHAASPQSNNTTRMTCSKGKVKVFPYYR